MKLTLPAALALATLVLVAASAETASAAAPTQNETVLTLGMVLDVGGQPVVLTGTMTIVSRVETVNGKTHLKAWYSYEFASADGTVRSHGSTHRDIRSGSGGTHDLYNYHLVFVKRGEGVVAHPRLLVHYVYNANGELVVMKVL